MLTPKTIHRDISAHHAQVLTIVEQNPWLIPALTALHTVPIAVAVHGFWKSRALGKQLKIEREKTKQLALQQVDKAETIIKAHHPRHPFHRG